MLFRIVSSYMQWFVWLGWSNREHHPIIKKCHHILFHIILYVCDCTFAILVKNTNGICFYVSVGIKKRQCTEPLQMYIWCLSLCPCVVRTGLLMNMMLFSQACQGQGDSLHMMSSKRWAPWTNGQSSSPSATPPPKQSVQLRMPTHSQRYTHTHTVGQYHFKADFIAMTLSHALMKSSGIHSQFTGIQQ